MAVYHANPDAERNFEGSSSYILRYLFLKFSNTSANNNVLPWKYKSWYSPKFSFQNLYKIFLHARNLNQ